MTPMLADVAAPDLARPAIAVLGHIDSASPRGVVKGWCAALPSPSAPRRVMIVLNGRPVLEHILCDEFRPDLRDAGHGNGNHGFTARLPATLAAPGEEQELHLFDHETGVLLGTPATISWAAPGACPPALEAHVDVVSEEGVITGWCWDRNDPDRRVAIDILADGVVCASAVAAMYREDLKAAGKGSGHCGFTAVLPWEVVDGRGEISLVLQDREHGVPVGARVTLRRPDLLTAEARIAVLERKLTLLRREIGTTRDSAATRAATDAVAVSFRMIARFFDDLAAGRETAAGLGGVRARLEHAADTYPLLPFGLPGAAEVTIFILADGDLDHLHACLAALHRAGVDQRARLCVLAGAGGAGEDLLCLHAISRNVQAVVPHPSETINDLLAAAATPLIAVLGARDPVPTRWLDSAIEAIAEPGVALAGSGAGLRADTTEGLVRVPGPAANSAPVDAPDAMPVLLRRDAFLEAGGLDLSYTSEGTQMLALGLRLRGIGRAVVTLPAAGEPHRSLLDDAAAEDVSRLLAASRQLLRPRPVLATEPERGEPLRSRRTRPRQQRGLAP